MTSRIVHIVDDDILARTGTARLVAAVGFETRTYESARHFAAALEWDMAGCIVLDGPETRPHVTYAHVTSTSTADTSA
jgi:FixJ family two-component response regulator